VCCIYAALINHNGAPSHTMTGGMPPRIPENGNIHSSRSQNGLLDDKKSGSSANNAWRRWSLDKSGFSDFQGYIYDQLNFLLLCTIFVILDDLSIITC
jgi:hypothetical protein